MPFSAHSHSAQALDWRQFWRQPAAWLAALLLAIGASAIFVNRLEHYLSLQAQGFIGLQLDNDLLGPLFGALAALVVFTAPLLALAMRPVLLLNHRRLQARYRFGRPIGLLLLALLLILKPLLPVFGLLALGASLKLHALLLPAAGILLLACVALLMSLALAVRIQHPASALAFSYLLLLALVALDALPGGFGLFGQFRPFYQGELTLAGLGYLTLLALAARVSVQAYLTANKASTYLSLGLLLAAIVAGHLPGRWQAEPVLNPAQQQMLAIHGKDLQLTLISADADARSDWRAQLEALKIWQPSLSINEQHPETLPPNLRDQLPGNSGLLLQRQNQSAWLALPIDQLPARIVESLSTLVERRDAQIVFLEGNGERELFGEQARDLRKLRDALQAQGLSVQPLALMPGMSIPDNTSVLVIASPQNVYPTYLRQALLQYLMRGGHLLWLREPDEPEALTSLETYLGVSRLPGIVVDPVAVQRGSPHPAIVIIDHYPEHPAFKHLQELTALPWTQALQAQAAADVAITPLLQSHPDSRLVAEPDQSWPDDAPKGPFTVGLLWQKTVNEQTQRVAVIGDGHFLADTALHNYGNSALALSLLQWLAFGDEALSPVLERRSEILFLPGWALNSLRYGIWLWPLALLLLGSLTLWRWRRR